MDKQNRIYQSPCKVELSVEVVSVSPKVFIIKQFLSDSECQCLIDAAKGHMKDSVLVDGSGGVMKKDMRISTNTWLSRHENPIIDTVYKRAADALLIDEKILDESNVAEPLQVVNYQKGGKFDYHYDWFISYKSGGSDIGESRYLTLLLYLSNKENEAAGGETAFYHGRFNPNHDPRIISTFESGQKGIKIHPGKGGAVLFYNLLEDGNGDIKTQHAGLPVMVGEKWLANLWVWDPKK